jgi:hypothetical protein
MRSPLDRLRGGEPGPPDFIGVGAVGAGAWWWFRLLLAHPEIKPPHARRYALRYFERFCAAEMTDADVAAYHARFPRLRGAISGEWSGRYMLDPWTPPLLKRAAPDAKLLVILADPIERYRAIFADRRAAREPGEMFFMADVVDRRSHASQLRRLQRFYDPAQILVLQFERCRRDPVAEYRRTLEFLGVRDVDRVPRRLRRRAAGKPEALHVELLVRLGLPEGTKRRVAEKLTGRPVERETVELWPDLEAALHTAFDPEVEQLAAMVPELDLSLWPNFAHLAKRERAPVPSA